MIESLLHQSDPKFTDRESWKGPQGPFNLGVLNCDCSYNHLLSFSRRTMTGLHSQTNYIRLSGGRTRTFFPENSPGDFSVHPESSTNALVQHSLNKGKTTWGGDVSQTKPHRNGIIWLCGSQMEAKATQGLGGVRPTGRPCHQHHQSTNFEYLLCAKQSTKYNGTKDTKTNYLRGTALC